MNKIIYEDTQNIISNYKSILQKLDNKTIYIAGATGMVGCYLVYTLMEYANSVDDSKRPTVIVGARSKEKALTMFSDYTGNNNFKLYIEDVVNVDSESMGRVDYIIHAASSATPTHFKNDPMGIINSNIVGTKKLLNIAHKNKARFCFISTMEIYGEVNKVDSQDVVKVVEEDYGAVDTLDLRSAYPESKRMAENICIAYGEQYGTDSVLARLSHTYGPGMGIDDTRVQTQFMKSALNGEGITLLSDGESKRTYTYIADATSAILTAMINGERNEAYNIADESSFISIKTLAQLILDSAGENSGELKIDIPINDTNMWSRATGMTTLKCDKLKAIGWSAVNQVKYGVSRTLDYHRIEIGK